MVIEEQESRSVEVMAKERECAANAWNGTSQVGQMSRESEEV